MKKSTYLQKKKHQEPLNGILLINKDKICTSHQIVDEVRNILNQKAVGHAGTLDPIARGLLVVLCGIGTKLSHYFLTKEKRYRLSIKFGLETKTLDIQGEILKSIPVSLKKETIKEALLWSEGDLELSVPLFSAVKVKGRKLYSYAFSGKSIPTPVKKMSFWDLSIHNMDKDSVDLSISCSKGSYIRSWVHFVGQKTKTGACLTKLERLSSGSFYIQNSLTVEDLREKLLKKFPKNEKQMKDLLGKSFLFPGEPLSFPGIQLTKRNIQILRTGRIPSFILQETAKKEQVEVNKKGEAQTLKVLRDEKLVALLEMRPYKKIRILKNFPNQNFSY